MTASAPANQAATITLPEGKATQPKKSFVLHTNRKGEAIQVFKTHPQGSRRQRLMFASMMRRGLRRGRLQAKLVREVLVANPELADLAKIKAEGALEALVMEVANRHFPARIPEEKALKGLNTIERVMRRELGLPDQSEEATDQQEFGGVEAATETPVEAQAVA